LAPSSGADLTGGLGVIKMVSSITGLAVVNIDVMLLVVEQSGVNAVARPNTRLTHTISAIVVKVIQYSKYTNVLY
jgi:hypothetical protein